MRKYRYVGNGAGVPGLPHEISQAEIEQMNDAQGDQWRAALSQGLYVDIADGEETIPPLPRKTKSRKSAPADKGE